ncbi:MAG: hypothetical protein UT24_C0028G0009 [Candidatus Woesebacteria bacterium GW2011_GWB1_39_12]|uniref:Uncharacterized protein n=2 Tax=Candidatus Woeseibacteriota TaxID=1752722 RepID=A0A0G0M0W3_9BACT|nr:MAG: hypothetical protein UT23_C0021G0020 [Candidatus Woesebacteria bacterium GW2011_GWA1_39_12]KKQ99050.1 MAG: hypothetical protein UT24_C0028G0009 [Candidatus Woesebacteria bacterium GW2011_GWB1_39_12]
MTYEKEYVGVTDEFSTDRETEDERVVRILVKLGGLSKGVELDDPYSEEEILGSYILTEDFLPRSARWLFENGELQECRLAIYNHEPTISITTDTKVLKYSVEDGPLVKKTKYMLEGGDQKQFGDPYRVSARDMLDVVRLAESLVGKID